MSKPIDYSRLRRAIEGGAAEAAREAGIKYAAIQVEIVPQGALGITEGGLVQADTIIVEVIELPDAETFVDFHRGLPS